MSKTIDERVVEMRFDNKQFEQNVQTSISSIEKLEKSLKLKGASKGLDDVNAAAKNCNMTPLSNAVETVKMRFSALEVMAVTALANITNSALNAGKNIVSALTIDPIKTGFQEYETQINAVQTILANTQSKGTTIDQVNAALDELNKYADQTIYNFTEMTRNIGTFTAAGVDLDKSVTSIKGIANLAAASGSNAYQASTAMYQLSQAIAAGKVSLQDWNSVVNAGMGGQLFQDALTRTAEHFGTNMDAMIEQYGSFRASLTEGGWLTTEVLTETLTQLSGAYSEADLIAQGYTEEQAKEITKLAQTALDAATKVKTFTQLWDTLKESVQSGWTQSWEIIIGDFEEAKELLTEVSNALGNMVNASAEARNKMLQDWKDLGGRTALIEAVRNAFEGVLSIIKPVKEAFREVFPPMTGEQLYNLTVGLQELTEKFKMGEETANNLKRTFKGVFALFDIGLQGVKALVGGFADLIGYVAPAGDGILGFTASIGDFIVGIDEAIKSSDAFNKAIEGIGNFLKPIADGIKTFVKTVADAFSEFANVDTSGLDNFADKVQTRFEPFVKLGELVKKAFEGIIGIVEKAAPVLLKLGSIVANAFGNLGEAILTAFDTASFDPILDLINTGLFSAILIGVKKFIDSLSEITENGGGILGSFKDILDGVKGSLEAWQSSLKAGTLLKIAGAMAILTAAIVALSLVDSEKLNASLGALSVLFVELLGSMAIFEKIMNGAAIKGMGQLTIAMIGMSTAVLILAGAVQKLSGLDWDELLKGLVGVAGLSAILVASATALSKTSKGLIKGSAGLVVFAAAVLTVSAALAIFTPVLKSLGNMSWESIARGLVALAGSFTVLGVAGVALGPLTPAILGLSAAIAVLGVGCLAAGAGILAFSTGLSALAVSGAAGAASLVVAVSSILSLIPLLFESIGEGILSLAGVIANGGPAIAEAFTVLVLAAVDALVTAVPAVVDGLFVLIDSVLSALVEHTPTIVEQLFDILIGIIQAITTKLPELIKAGVELLMAFFDGVIDALSGIDVNVLIKGIAGIGLLSAIMLALSAVASLVPGAMVGVLGMGAVIAELALVLAAVGALAQIPGLEWLIGEGGNLLQGIGTAIGKFVGGIVGGFMSGVSSQFPQIGADLSAFMTNVQPFIEGATQLNPSMLDGVKALAETILILTAADILNGLTSWLTGGSSLSDFATQLVPFGEAMRDFSIAIAGMDGELVANAATAGRTLAEMAATLPNSGGVIGFFTGENDMSAFGAQLIPFGEAMMGFANAVRGLDADTVTNAATAGKAMAEMATTIPNSGGVVGFFAGENDMDAFGEQLVPFGEAMMLFSQAVKGLDANVIVESATAGKALIELANTVPNSGGVVGFFTGENDMDTFGEKLVPFGRAMKSYSDAIAGIDVEAVTNSATAGKAVVELANTLPNTGGLVSWFTGDNDIAAFGTSLVSFGKSFAQYSDYMKDVDANIVTTTTNAATSIVELQKSLPKEGGWFSDDMTLASFGSDMASFGSHFSNYYNSISGIDTTLLSGVITQTNRLVSMANGMVGLDTSGMTSFSSALTTLGETGVTGFINAFNNAESKVTAAASSMLSSFINGANAKKSELTTTFTTLVQAVLTAINGKQGEFQTSGSTLMVKFIAGVRSQDSPSRTTFTNIVSGCLTAIRNKYGEFTSTGTQTMVKLIAGIRSQDSSARMAFTTIISACLTVIKNKYAEFTSTGRECMVKFIAGVRSKDSELRTAFTTMLSGSITAIKDYYSQFKSAGSYLVDGFCDGISENTWKAEAKARAMAAAAAEAAEDELDEHSPSKRFYGIGNFAGVGFINALIDNVSKAGKAGREIARSSIDGLNDIISRIADYVDADMDVQPTIRPVLDLSAVEAGTGRLNALFSRNQALSVSTGMNDRVSEIEVQNGESSPTGNTYQFTQNNYSPKALSRIDIYRQTKNQFSAMKGLVGNT